MRLSRFMIPALVLAGTVLALAGCGKGAAPAAKANDPASAPVLLIAAEDLRTLKPGALASGPVISGSVQPERRADLRAEVAAVVLQLAKDNGEAVRAGDLLLRLDDTAIRDSLMSAEETLRAATQAHDQSERQLQRLRTLQAQGMTSAQAAEDAEVRRNSAQSDLVAARARAVAARQQLQRTSVRAPFDGVVSERKVSVGDTVQIGRELMKVIDPRSMRFEGLVSADRMGELKVGQPVRFRVNGYPQGDFAGSVRRIDAAANATTRQVEVVVDFTDAAAAPRVAGLFAEGRIETGSAQVLMVPESAVLRAGESAFVWRVGAGKIAKVPVKLGPRDERSGDLPVLQGLSAGDRILRSPGSTLLDGQRFEFAAAGAASAAAGVAATGGPAVNPR